MIEKSFVDLLNILNYNENEYILDIYMNFFSQAPTSLQQKPIMEYQNFLDTVNDNPKKQDSFRKLDILRVHLQSRNQDIQDPVKYLYHLYFERWFSLDDVLQEVKDIWLDYKDYRGLHYLFTKIFHWELRQNTQLTSHESEKRASWVQMKHLNTHNQTIVESIEKRFEEVLKIISKQINFEKTDFSIEEYNSFSWKEQKRKKVFYLLECYSWISTDIFKQMHVEYGIWLRGLARIINSKVQIAKLFFNVQDNDNIEVSPANLESYFKINAYSITPLATSSSPS